MKVVILAGGFGTRLSEETIIKPKPMIEIGGEPVLIHLMKYFSSFGFNDFIIAVGYKSQYIKEYLFNYLNLQNDLLIDFKENKLTTLSKKSLDWKVRIIETGNDTNTGGRLKKIEKFLDDKQFLFTYGDGLSDVNLKELITQHNKSNAIVTLTGVRSPARFGVLKLQKEKIIKFSEKETEPNEWINGGFMVMNHKIFNYLHNSKDSLEFDALEIIANENKLACYKHNGFWQCMDNLKDKMLLEKVWESNKKVPWKK